jgi:hypothetical protein
MKFKKGYSLITWFEDVFDSWDFKLEYLLSLGWYSTANVVDKKKICPASVVVPNIMSQLEPARTEKH